MSNLLPSDVVLQALSAPNLLDSADLGSLLYLTWHDFCSQTVKQSSF